MSDTLPFETELGADRASDEPALMRRDDASKNQPSDGDCHFDLLG